MTWGSGRLGILLEPVQNLTVALAPSVDTSELPPSLRSPRVTHLRLTELTAADAEDGAVVLVARDRVELRRVVAACEALPASVRVGCVLLERTAPPLTVGRPNWPRLMSVVAQTVPVCFVLLEFDSPVPAGAVVADLARRLTPNHLMSGRWPSLGLDRSVPETWAPGDALSVVTTREELDDTSGDYPPDAVVVTEPWGEPAAPMARGGTAHHVLGELGRELHVGSPMTWGDLESGGGEALRRLQQDGPLALGPVDEAIVNPHGFLRTTHDPASLLEPTTNGSNLLVIATHARDVEIRSASGVGEEAVQRLRSLTAVHVPWRGASGPQDYCRVVAGLALAGIPLTCDPPPAWATALLHPDLVEAMTSDVDLDDPLSREVHSIRLRRAAHARHGTQAFRRGVALRTGTQLSAPPLVSVLLPTRRPEMLEFALRQVGRQRGVEAELVLATHGYEPDPAVLDEASDRFGVPVRNVAALPDRPFGELLNDAARVARGDVLLKMDDDDWYGRDFVADLLMARSYSGADVIGTPPEFNYIEPLDVTVRRKDVSEKFRNVVAGGTMMISREAFTSVGGFRRMNRYVDAGLLRAVLAAGGSIYRTHGHGYLLRRTGSGHTWDPGLGYFVSRARTMQQWRGFAPSPLLGPDDVDTPSATRQAGA